MGHFGANVKSASEKKWKIHRETGYSRWIVLLLCYRNTILTHSENRREFMMDLNQIIESQAGLLNALLVELGDTAFSTLTLVVSLGVASLLSLYLYFICGIA